MKKLTIGILAHVDAGKTTLSEGLLYAAGALRTLGRVDHGDAFLDTEALERERGITIFAKQAVLDCGGTHITLLDTPGHVDFSAEAERTLQVLDYAILVISGTDGVQGHTRTLWRLLERYGVPTFLFINKMDLAGADRAALLTDLQKSFGACVDLGAEPNERDEHAALTDEAALEELLERGELSDDTLAALISARKIFPCCFGSALKNEGVAEFLQLLTRFTREPARGADFGARVFKISRDAQGTRLTHLKVTGGTLRAKTQLPCGKADQLRLYSGAKFRPLDEAGAGEVVAVTGLADTYPGQGLGAEADGEKPVLQSVLTYRILLPDGTDAHTVLPKLRELEDEDPMLRIVWEEASGELHAELMGEVQLEILQRLISDRFGLSVMFGEGGIVYKETLANTVEGVGHFEPLRHYAEVHLLLEPAPRGSGVQLASACPTDELDLNWQRLILTHLVERAHPGVLTGSALTDVKMTLLAGRAHLKHTEGGAFEPKRAPARTALDETRYNIKNQKTGPEYLLVDGYNIIFAWDALKKLAAQDVAAAREALAGILANYRGWRRCEIILVFDAYKVKGNPGSMEKKNGIYIVYTKEAQTADSYIERATYDLGKNHRVRVATSDNMEQVIILGHGALRISARAFEEEVAEAEGQISDLIERWNVRDFDLRRVRATATIIGKKEEKGS